MAEYTLVQTGTPVIPAKETNFDYLVRLTGNQRSQAFYVNSWPTEDIAKMFYSVFEDKKFQLDTLVGVIKWQADLLDYNGHYNAYLLGQTTDEEFEQVAQKFAYEPLDVPPDHLFLRIRTILDLTDINYTPGDFASMFRCNRESVIRAVDKLNETHLQRVVEK
jgi:hypothetical protein